jgi:hypothetical protein
MALPEPERTAELMSLLTEAIDEARRQIEQITRIVVAMEAADRHKPVDINSKAYLDGDYAKIGSRKATEWGE